jgi:hypothetical protein
MNINVCLNWIVEPFYHFMPYYDLTLIVGFEITKQMITLNFFLWYLEKYAYGFPLKKKTISSVRA